MSWQRRGNRSYFYHVVREGGRLRTTYCGNGPEAEAMARERAEARAIREAARESRRRIEANLDRVGRLAEAVGRAMELSGYYSHRGVWRERGLRTMQFKKLGKAIERERARRHFEDLPEGGRAAEIERLQVDVADAALSELVSLVTGDPLRAEATKRAVESMAEDLAGQDSSPVSRLLARITATLATQSDVASGRLYRVAGVPGGMEHPIGRAADRWAKSALRATTSSAKALALVQAVERRESERAARRSNFKVVG
jgi:hypothetical protein